MHIGVNVTHLSDFRAGIGTVASNLLHAFGESAREDVFFLYSPMPVELDFSLPAHFAMRTGRFPEAMKHLWIGLQGRAMKRDGVEAYLGMNYMMPFGKAAFSRSAIFVYDMAHRFRPETMTWKNRFGMRVLFERSLSKADVILTCTATVRDEIAGGSGVDKRKIEVVPLGVDSSFSPLDREACYASLERALHVRPPFLLFTGTLEPRKNLPVLLRAASLLCRDFKDLRLVLTGPYGWKSKGLYEEVRRLGLEGAVRFTGFVSREDLHRLYCGARVFVYPSLYEGFGLPILEAMRCGAPVVTSKASCMPEVSGGAALLADPGSPEDVAAKIRSILENDALAADLGERGRERARGFTWEKTARAVLGILKA